MLTIEISQAIIPTFTLRKYNQFMMRQLTLMLMINYVCKL